MKKLVLSFLLLGVTVALAQKQSQFYKPEFEVLKAFKGDWKVTYTFTSPYSDPSQGKGTATASEVLNGSLVQLNTTLNYDEYSFLRLNTFGYDANIKKYYIIGADESGIMPYVCYGGYNEKKREFVFDGAAKSDDEEKKLQLRIYFERDDKFFYEYYVMDGGRWFKTLTMAFIKK